MFTLYIAIVVIHVHKNRFTFIFLTNKYEKEVEAVILSSLTHSLIALLYYSSNETTKMAKAHNNYQPVKKNRSTDFY